MKLSLLLPVSAVGALALMAARTPTPIAGGVVGRALPEADIADLAQTEAESFDDYAGRAVLLEFFAYW
ncbi:MAG: hypothetical protein AAF368_03635 [Planctomycetota bacterium]